MTRRFKKPTWIIMCFLILQNYTFCYVLTVSCAKLKDRNYSKKRLLFYLNGKVGECHGGDFIRDAELSILK